MTIKAPLLATLLMLTAAVFALGAGPAARAQPPPTRSPYSPPLRCKT
jgi:hypothetical protein